MENANIVLTAITTVGFPIAMCLILIWYVAQESKNHKEEVNSLKDVLIEIKLAMQKLTDKLDA